MSDVVVEAQHSLDSLVSEFNEQYTLAQDAGAVMVEHLIKCGEALIKVRDILPHGEWGAWVVREIGVHPKTATMYVRFARNAEILREHQPTTQLAARKILERMDVPKINAREEERKLARQLRKRGMSHRAIASHLGVSKFTAAEWINPRASVDRSKRRKEMDRNAYRALERENRDAVVKSKGGEIADAYGFVRKALKKLEAASVKEGKEIRPFIQSAMSRLYGAEDLIVKASKGALAGREDEAS